MSHTMIKMLFNIIFLLNGTLPSFNRVFLIKHVVYRHKMVVHRNYTSNISFLKTGDLTCIFFGYKHSQKK